MKSKDIYLALVHKFRIDRYAVYDEVSVRDSVTGKDRRFDFVAMAKLNPSKRARTHAVEIKVSRSDFLSEIKSEKYLAMTRFCTRASFAVPKGMILKEEVPNGFGLIEVNDNMVAVTRAKPKINVVDIEAEAMLLRRMILKDSGFLHERVARSQRSLDRIVGKMHGKDVGHDDLCDAVAERVDDLMPELVYQAGWEASRKTRAYISKMYMPTCNPMTMEFIKEKASIPFDMYSEFRWEEAVERYVKNAKSN